MKIKYFKNKKYYFILSLFLVFLFLIKIQFLGVQNHYNDAEKLNVILISIDSLGANHISSYGYHRETTPNIDIFGKEGIIFKNHISQSYLTPISEMSVHTGMYPSSSGFVDFNVSLNEKFITLSEILKKYNYRNAAFGNSPEFFAFPAIENSFNRGFDIYDFRNFSNKNFSSSFYRFNHVDNKKIVNFIKKNRKNPSFVWVAIGSPHFPYGKFPGKFEDFNYNGFLKNEKLDWLDGVLPWIYNKKLYYSDKNTESYKREIQDEDIQYIIDQYDNDIFETDKQIGELLSLIKKNKLDKNTIIVIHSEHGEEMGERGYINHYDIFDSTIKTFLMIKNPKLNKNGLIVENQTQSIDLLPTILDFLNIPPPHQVQGDSLLPTIKGERKDDKPVFIERTPLWERVMFYGYKRENYLDDYMTATHKKQLDFYDEKIIQEIQGDSFLNEKDFAVRTNEWKLIYRKSKDFQEKYSWWKVLSGDNILINEYELYNLKDDPEEKNNVINQYPEIAGELKNQLMVFLDKNQRKEDDIKSQENIQEYF